MSTRPNNQSFVDGDVLAGVGASCPNLLRINISGNPITGAAIIDLCKSLPLKFLDMGMCGFEDTRAVIRGALGIRAPRTLKKVQAMTSTPLDLMDIRSEYPDVEINDHI